MSISAPMQTIKIVEPVRNVSDTAAWVAHFRADESRRAKPVFVDHLAEKLAGERGSAIGKVMDSRTAWSIVARTAAIDRLIVRMVNEDGCDLVINLAAGLDTRPYRLNLPSTLSWVEVDMPSLVDYKEHMLKDEKPRCKRLMLSADLRDEAQRRTVLRTACSTGSYSKVVVLTEGLLAYLTESAVTDLARDLRGVPGIYRWVADVVGTDLQGGLPKLWKTRLANTPMQFFPKDAPQFFADLGWHERQWHSNIFEAVKIGRAPFYLRWLTGLLQWLPFMPGAKRLERMAGTAVLSPRPSEP